MLKKIFFIIITGLILYPLHSQNAPEYGMWILENVIDEFGTPTGERYIKNRIPIIGAYSDSSNKDSRLLVDIKIFRSGRSNNILITPYLRRNNVPGIPMASRSEYRVAVRDKDGFINRSLVFYFREKDSWDFYNVRFQNFTLLHNAFLKGGTVQIRIETHENERNKESYAFDLLDVNNYREIYNVLMSD